MLLLDGTSCGEVLAPHRSSRERTFAPLIDGLKGSARKRRMAALVALTDVYTWKLLRLDLGLSRADTVRALVELIGELAPKD